MLIVDNMALLGAARVLDRGMGRRGAWQARHGDRKWDYKANDKLQIAVDVACLAQLCQAFVLYGQTATTRGYADRWAGFADGPLKPLFASVDLLPLKGELGSVLLGLAANIAVLHADRPDFHEYVDYLATEPLLGTFLRVSNGYFETGYSDPGMFEDIARDHEYVGHARRLADKIHRSWTNSRVDALVTRVHRFLDATEAMRAYRRADRYNGESAHPLARLGLPAATWVESASAAEGFVKNLAATIFYALVARLHNADYAPHPLRVPLAAVDVADDPDGASPINERSALDRLAFLRATRAGELNKHFAHVGGSGGALYADLEFPFVLASVLDGCRCGDDFVGRLVDLRDSRKATRFRRWFTELRQELDAGDLSLVRMDRKLTQMRQALSHAAAEFGADGADRTRFKVTVGINLAVISAQTELEPGWRKRMPRDLRILMDFGRIGNATPRLDRLLRPAFGEEVAEAWSSSQTLLSPIVRPGAPAPFDKR